MQMSALSTRTAEAVAHNGRGMQLTKAADTRYKKNNTLAQACTVSRGSGNIYYVTYTASQIQKRRTVDLDSRTCSCLKWQQHEEACLHAIAAYHHAGHMDDFTDFLNQAYSTLYNSSCFSDTLSNAQGIRLPDKSQLIPDGAMKPAVRVRQAGRPRKRRIRSAGTRDGAPVRQHKCSRCGRVGHHSTTCSAPSTM